MKVLRYSEPGNAEIIDAANPRIKPNQILSKSLYCSISAGTEMGFYRGTAPQLTTKCDQHGNFYESSDAIKYPMQANSPGVWWMGYANVSEVIEAGNEINGVKKGDLIFSQKGHCEYQITTENEIIKLPASVNPEHAALLALIEIAYNGILDADLKLLGNAVVLGLGTIGQLVLQMLKLSGVNVIGVDCLPNRLETAKKNGACKVLNFMEEDIARQIYDLTSEKGADVVFEASGNIKALAESMKICAYNGKVIAISFYNSDADSLYLGREFHHKRINLISSQISGINPCLSNLLDFKRRKMNALKLMELIDIESLISHRFSFEDLPEALKIIDKNPAECNAVIIKYN